MNPPIYIGFSVATNGIDKYVGKLIRWFTGGDVNHAFLLYFDPDWQVWVTMGANSNGVSLISLNTFIQTREIKYIFELTFDLWLGAQTLAGDINSMKYDYRGLVGMAYVQIALKLGDKYPDNFLDNHEDVFCSEWIGQMVDASLLYTNSSFDNLYKLWPLFRTETDTISPYLLCSTILHNTLFINVTDTLDLGGDYGISNSTTSNLH